MSVPSIITRAPDGLDSIRRYPVWSSGDWGDEVAMPTRMAVKKRTPKKRNRPAYTKFCSPSPYKYPVHLP